MIQSYRSLFRRRKMVLPKKPIQKDPSICDTHFLYPNIPKSSIKTNTNNLLSDLDLARSLSSECTTKDNMSSRTKIIEKYQMDSLNNLICKIDFSLGVNEMTNNENKIKFINRDKQNLNSNFNLKSINKYTELDSSLQIIDLIPSLISHYIEYLGERELISVCLFCRRMRMRNEWYLFTDELYHRFRKEIDKYFYIINNNNNKLFSSQKQSFPFPIEISAEILLLIYQSGNDKNGFLLLKYIEIIETNIKFIEEIKGKVCSNLLECFIYIKVSSKEEISRTKVYKHCVSKCIASNDQIFSLVKALIILREYSRASDVLFNYLPSQIPFISSSDIISALSLVSRLHIENNNNRKQEPLMIIELLLRQIPEILGTISSDQSIKLIMKIHRTMKEMRGLEEKELKRTLNMCKCIYEVLLTDILRDIISFNGIGLIRVLKILKAINITHEELLCVISQLLVQRISKLPIPHSIQIYYHLSTLRINVPDINSTILSTAINRSHEFSNRDIISFLLAQKNLSCLSVESFKILAASLKIDKNPVDHISDLNCFPIMKEMDAEKREDDDNLIENKNKNKNKNKINYNVNFHTKTTLNIIDISMLLLILSSNKWMEAKFTSGEIKIKIKRGNINQENNSIEEELDPSFLKLIQIIDLSLSDLSLLLKNTTTSLNTLITLSNCIPVLRSQILSLQKEMRNTLGEVVTRLLSSMLEVSILIYRQLYASINKMNIRVISRTFRSLAESGIDKQLTNAFCMAVLINIKNNVHLSVGDYSTIFIVLKKTKHTNIFEDFTWNILAEEMTQSLSSFLFSEIGITIKKEKELEYLDVISIVSNLPIVNITIIQKLCILLESYIPLMTQIDMLNSINGCKELLSSLIDHHRNINIERNRLDIKTQGDIFDTFNSVKRILCILCDYFLPYHEPRDTPISFKDFLSIDELFKTCALLLDIEHNLNLINMLDIKLEIPQLDMKSFKSIETNGIEKYSFPRIKSINIITSIKSIRRLCSRLRRIMCCNIQKRRIPMNKLLTHLHLLDATMIFDSLPYDTKLLLWQIATYKQKEGIRRPQSHVSYIRDGNGCIDDINRYSHYSEIEDNNNNKGTKIKEIAEGDNNSFRYINYSDSLYSGMYFYDYKNANVVDKCSGLLGIPRRTINNILRKNEYQEVVYDTPKNSITQNVTRDTSNDLDPSVDHILNEGSNERFIGLLRKEMRHN